MDFAFSASLLSGGGTSDVVLLEVDDHLMCGFGKAHHESMERLRQRMKFGKWHRLSQDGPPFCGTRQLHTVTGSKLQGSLDKSIREKQRPNSFPRVQCLDRSSEASEV